MSGISSKGIGKIDNKYKYNGYEENKDFDINFYEAFYRSHDPQVGRFWQIDPKPNTLHSLYASMANNPILFSDKLGDTVINGQLMEAVNEAAATTLSGVTVTNSSNTNIQFGVALANLIASRSGINSIEKLLEGTGVRLAEGRVLGSFLGPAALIASLPFTLASDNMSAPARRQMADQILNDMLMEGDLAGVIEYVENWNNQPKNQHDRIVFRYMSSDEFRKRLEPDGDFAQALPFDRNDNLVVKYITPDIYASSSQAKSSLSLPNAPDVAIWTFESQVPSKMPAGPGRYQTVKPRYGEPGGGREATIIQPFPIHGFFPLLR